MSGCRHELKTSGDFLCAVLLAPRGGDCEPRCFWCPAASFSRVAIQAPTPAAVGLANPASVNCDKVGGELQIEKNGAGAEYGVCIFEDNRQCEEWALFRGQCPMGGLRVTGYRTPGARYCVIRGGTYTVTARRVRPRRSRVVANFPTGIPAQRIPCSTEPVLDLLSRCISFLNRKSAREDLLDGAAAPDI